MDTASALAELRELAGEIDRQADVLADIAGEVVELDDQLAAIGRRMAASRRREAATLRELADVIGRDLPAAHA